MKISRLISIVLTLCFACVAVTSSVVAAQNKMAIRFGALPVLQALPLYVAQERGLFTKAGLEVDLVPFNTAAEKDIALSTGKIDGCFADLVTPLVLRGNGQKILLVATTYSSRGDRRMFGVLAKPGSSHRSPADLQNVPIALASNSIVHYVTETLLTNAGVPRDRVASVESKNIGMRMQMLLAGHVEAAALPEPLVSAALAQGATLVADDSGSETSQTVLVFAESFLKERPEAVTKFLAAVNEAAAMINAKPDEVREAMVQHVRLPAPLKDKYPVPRFPRLKAPDKDAVVAVAQWLRSREVIPRTVSYEEVVDGRLIP
jgi:NitT/TauT family transport system substrate-binding protein